MSHHSGKKIRHWCLSAVLFLAPVALYACSYGPVEPGNETAAHRADPDYANHLKGQTSPYLLAHLHDPVDWHPWGDDAFALARRLNKPVFISSGFAACHWCHVMQRESFLDQQTARYLNDHFVAVLIDREERPDLDRVYTRALEQIGGHPGWPLTIIVTPDRLPFVAGTYYPPRAKGGQPAFLDVLKAANEMWIGHREQVDGVGRQIFKALQRQASRPEFAPKEPTAAALEQAGASILNRIDPDFGGLAGERKFPNTSLLRFCQLLSQRNGDGGKYKDFVENTLSHMDRGGVQDQLRGGFFRYAVDPQWRVPHFEKMLGGNALIASCYLRQFNDTRNPRWKAVGLQTIDFCLRELAAVDHTFYAGMDADSGPDGALAEGAYYTFSRDEVFAVLGEADGNWFCSEYGITGDGADRSLKTSRRDRGVRREKTPFLVNGRSVPARMSPLETGASADRLNMLRQKLASSSLMQKRIRPQVDKKIVVGWNGLMISALVDAYKVSDDAKYLIAAKQCAHLMHDRLAAEATNLSGNLNLDDYAYCIKAFLDLAEIDQDKNSGWSKAAVEANQYVLAHFVAPGLGFYFTPNYRKDSPLRLGCATDDGLPSPCAVELANLLRLDHRAFVRRVVPIYGEIAVVEPVQYAEMLVTISEMLVAK
ncbi:MAG: thioredoxin domain-containing protein [Cyanobacteria bacterium REEB67]|nr:thioredoxin domain-containing protein [Cyanobacteria bacterium REEB67]